MEIPTDPTTLADVLLEKSKDWKTTLEFLEDYGYSVGVEINKRVVSNIIMEKIEE